MDSIMTPKPITSQSSLRIHLDPEGGVVGFNVGATVFTTSYHYTAIDTPITFSATVDLPPGRLAIDYLWRFSDGEEAYGSEIVRTFAHVTPLRVFLEVKDNLGQRHIASKQIYLSAE